MRGDLQSPLPLPDDLPPQIENDNPIVIEQSSKIEPKKVPRNSSYLTPEDIINPRNRSTQTQPQMKEDREAHEAEAQTKATIKQDILDAIRLGRSRTSNSVPESSSAAIEIGAYREQLNKFIRPKWNAVAPSSAELNGNISIWPIVELNIAEDGRVTKAVIIRKSGNNMIDAAVETLLLDLKVVPAPLRVVAIQVTFDIR